MILFRFKDSNSFDVSVSKVFTAPIVTRPPAGTTRSEVITLRIFIIWKKWIKINKWTFLNSFFQWVGSECGHHATYTFYKAVKFSNKFSGTNGAGAGEGCGVTSPAGHKSSHQSAKETWKVLSIGQFFFVKIWAGSDLLSVAELQLLWEDKVGFFLEKYIFFTKMMK